MACQRHHLPKPKSDEINNPKNYRPITCLTTMYNILTYILTEYTYSFLIDSGNKKVAKVGHTVGKINY